jgi:hypothetical protein
MAATAPAMSGGIEPETHRQCEAVIECWRGQTSRRAGDDMETRRLHDRPSPLMKKRFLFPLTPLGSGGDGQNYDKTRFSGDHSDIGRGHKNALLQFPKNQ